MAGCSGESSVSLGTGVRDAALPDLPDLLGAVDPFLLLEPAGPHLVIVTLPICCC